MGNPVCGLSLESPAPPWCGGQASLWGLQKGVLLSELTDAFAGNNPPVSMSSCSYGTVRALPQTTQPPMPFLPTVLMTGP